MLKFRAIDPLEVGKLPRAIEQRTSAFPGNRRARCRSAYRAKHVPPIAETSNFFVRSSGVSGFPFSMPRVPRISIIALSRSSQGSDWITRSRLRRNSGRTGSSHRRSRPLHRDRVRRFIPTGRNSAQSSPASAVRIRLRAKHHRLFPNSLSVSKRLDQQCKGWRWLPPARVVKVIAGKERAPVIKYLLQSAG